MIPDTGCTHDRDTSAIRGEIGECDGCRRLRRTLCDLLARRPWSAVTVEALATAAGISVPVLRTHYPGVPECGVAALDEAAAEFTAVCASVLPLAEGCAERYVQVSEAILHWVASRPEAARMLFVVPAQTNDRALLDRVHACKRTTAALFERPDGFSPAGSTHVEFLVALFFQAAQRHLRSDDLGILRARVLALTPFTGLPLTPRRTVDLSE